MARKATRAAAYIRVSTEEQAQDGESLGAQERVIRYHTELMGIQDVHFYVDDGYSAKNTNRPQLQRLLGDCRDGKYSHVVVWRLDRFSRSLLDTLELVERQLQAYDVHFVSCTEHIDTSSTSGRLILNMLASVAQNEREVNEERVRMVCIELAKDCKHLGGVPPFGYRVQDKKYIVDEWQARAVRFIFDAYASGKSYQSILSRLRDAGYKTARGNDFKITTLYEMLRNEKYRGVYVYNKASSATRDGRRNSHKSKPEEEIIRIQGGIPSIVTEEQWKKAEVRRMKNQLDRAGNKARNVYLLTGILYCGHCGGKMYGDCHGRDRNGTLQRSYCCSQKCSKVRKEKLEGKVIDFLQGLTEEHLTQAASVASKILEDSRADEIKNAASLQEEHGQIIHKIRNIVDCVGTMGANTHPALLEELSALEAKKRSLEDKLASIQRQFEPLNIRPALDALVSLRDISQVEDEEKKSLIQSVLQKVVLTDSDFQVFFRVHPHADRDIHGGGEPLPLISLSVKL